MKLLYLQASVISPDDYKIFKGNIEKIKKLNNLKKDGNTNINLTILKQNRIFNHDINKLKDGDLKTNLIRLQKKLNENEKIKPEERFFVQRTILKEIHNENYGRNNFLNYDNLAG